MPSSLSVTDDANFFDALFTPTAPVVANVTPPVETASLPSEKTDAYSEIRVEDQIKDGIFETPAGTESDKAPAVAVEAAKTEPAQTVEAAPVTEEAGADDDEEYTRQVFKSAVKKAIDKGTFVDIEGFDDLDIDEDVLADLLDFNLEHKLAQGWERIKATNAVVNGILSVVEAGGNPDTIIDLFKEQQKIIAIDTKSTEGKLELIGKFYTDIVGLKPAEVSRKLKKLETETEEDLQAEFSAAETKYNEHFSNQQETIKANETRRIQQEEDAKRARVTQTKQFLVDQKVNPNTANKLLRDMYQPKWDLQDGSELLSEFDYQLLKLRQDPVKSAELAQYVLDQENYKKSLAQPKINAKVDETFEKLKFTPKRTATSPVVKPTGTLDTAKIKDLYKTEF